MPFAGADIIERGGYRGKALGHDATGKRDPIVLRDRRVERFKHHGGSGSSLPGLQIGIEFVGVTHLGEGKAENNENLPMERGFHDVMGKRILG
jgi:hypothetical protein